MSECECVSVCSTMVDLLLISVALGDGERLEEVKDRDLDLLVWDQDRERERWLERLRDGL